jgi:hypothetical protein
MLAASPVSRPGSPRSTLQRAEAMCAVCGKHVKSEDVEVREGEKVFHLDCYRLYKRRRPGTADVTPTFTT